MCRVRLIESKVFPHSAWTCSASTLPPSHSVLALTRHITPKWAEEWLQQCNDLRGMRVYASKYEKRVDKPSLRVRRVGEFEHVYFAGFR